MAYHQMHLNKNGTGMASMTACGRNILRTPMCTDWEGFKKTTKDVQCAKCAASKQAALNTRVDAQKAAAVVEAGKAYEALALTRAELDE